MKVVKSQIKSVMKFLTINDTCKYRYQGAGLQVGGQFYLVYSECVIITKSSNAFCESHICFPQNWSVIRSITCDRSELCSERHQCCLLQTSNKRMFVFYKKRAKTPTLGYIVPNSDKLRAPVASKTWARIAVAFIISDQSPDCIIPPFAAIEQEVVMLSPNTNCTEIVAFIPCRIVSGTSIRTRTSKPIIASHVKSCSRMS